MIIAQIIITVQTSVTEVADRMMSSQPLNVAYVIHHHHHHHLFENTGGHKSQVIQINTLFSVDTLQLKAKRRTQTTEINNFFWQEKI